MGKLEITLNVNHTDTEVVIDFGRSIPWIALPKKEAIRLAKAIMEHAGHVQPLLKISNN